MKISSVRIQNFRIYKDETINFEDYNCFVGCNGSGKSTVLYALNVFFRQHKDTKLNLAKLTENDFHHKDTSHPIKITVTFTNLSNQAKIDLKDYARQDELIVTAQAIFDNEKENAEVKQYGNRKGFEEFRTYFEANKAGEKVPELKEIYKKLSEKFTNLPSATTKQAMEDALKEYEANHPDDCSLIPSEDQFYGASKGTNRLAPHIQWVFVSASKDVNEESEESNTSALGQLLSRTVRSKVNFSIKLNSLREKIKTDYQKILDDEQAVLADLSTSLETKLQSWAHPDVSVQVLWKQDPEKSVKIDEPWAYIKLGECGFEAELARFGHGLQRSYMLALLQELVSSNTEEAPTLIMGIEEPELYQHPPQARHLAGVLSELSENNNQILVCSHSPQFIPGDDFETLRVVREKGNPKYSYITKLDYNSLAQVLKDSGADKVLLKEEGIQAKLFPTLNPTVNEMFFCKSLVLVEGIEDTAYLTTYLILSKKMAQFRKNGTHIVAVGGKSELIKPLAIAKLLDIPVYVIFDADTDKDQIQDEQRRNSEVGKHKKDNKAILHIINEKMVTEWPTQNHIEDNFTIWKTNITEMVKEEMGKEWETHVNASSEKYGNAKGLKKNPLAVSHALELAWRAGQKSNSLLELSEKLIQFK